MGNSGSVVYHASASRPTTPPTPLAAAQSHPSCACSHDRDAPVAISGPKLSGRSVAGHNLQDAIVVGEENRSRGAPVHAHVDSREVARAAPEPEHPVVVLPDADMQPILGRMIRVEIEIVDTDADPIRVLHHSEGVDGRRPRAERLADNHSRDAVRPAVIVHEDAKGIVLVPAVPADPALEV